MRTAHYLSLPYPRWLVTFLVLSSHFASAQNSDYLVEMEGTVTRGAPYQGTPLSNMKVYFMYPDTEEVIDSALTNSQGHYSCIFNYVGEKEKYNEMTRGMKVLGNPVVENVRMALGVFENDKYTLRVFDLSGRLLLSQDIDLYKGDNLVSVSGLGNAGVKIVSISNGKEAYTEKIVQSGTGAFSPSIAVTSASYSDRNLKSFVMDSVLVRVVPNPGTYLNFETQERVVEAVTSTVNFELPQQMYVFSTTLKPYLETGAPVTDVSPGFYVNVDFDDGSEQFPVVNGEINIERGIYPYEDALGSILISNDTSTYVVNGVANGVLNWTIIRQPHQKTNRPNVAQNETSQGPLIPDYKTVVEMDSLDTKVLYHYVIRKKAQTQPGVYEPLNSEFSKGLIYSSGGVLGASTFIDLAEFGVADSLDIVRFGFNYSTNLPNTPEEQARMDNILQLAVDTRYLLNADTLLPPHRIYTITSYSDSRWQELVARNYENSIMVYYHNGTPGNGRFWSSTYTYNGELRINKTIAKFNKNNSNGTIYAENFSAGTGMVEGAGQSLSPYVWDATNNVPTDYAYSISPIPALLNLGTGQNSAKESVPKQYYSITLHGDDKTYSYSGENSFTEFLSFFGMEK